MTTMKPILTNKPQAWTTLLRIVICTGIGLSLGIAFGLASSNILIGIFLGLGIGAGTGAAVEQQHRSAPRELDPTLWACTPLLVFAVIVAVIWFDLLV